MEISKIPKLMAKAENPLAIIGNLSPEYRSILENEYWQMGNSQKIVYTQIQHIKNKMEAQKFQ
jgi:hypothetical protein